jgi:kinesin family protein 6/9
LAEKYLKGDMEDIQIESLRQVKELFIQMRNKYKWLLNDIKTN